MKYLNESLETYLEDLSSAMPAPGGGSASALAAALGVSLFLMAANFTKGKKAYQKFAKDIKKIIRELTARKKKFKNLIDEDIAVYKRLDKVFKMPKTAQREKMLQSALKEAAKVPCKICALSLSSLKIAPELRKKGNRNLFTDIDCGMLFLNSAAKAARVNMDINLKYIKDRKFVKVMRLSSRGAKRRSNL